MQPDTTCGTNGRCDGAEACQLYPAGTGCAGFTCASSTQQRGYSLCNGAGTYNPGPLIDCSPYVCEGNTCRYFCADNGDCDYPTYSYIEEFCQQRRRSSALKFGIMFANAGPFADPELFSHLVRTAESAGIESAWTVEHVFVPRNYESTYPYAPGGKMPMPENAPIPDPFIALAYAAAITKKIRLATGVLILPQRHPAYVAKEVASLDVLSGGRVMLGIGVGWLKEEFDALDVSFDDRAARTRESVEALRSLWSDGPSTFRGKFFRWNEVESNPKPVQGPKVPIIVGGHTDIAARRAARYGDGFFPGRGSAERLAELVGIMRDECAKIGRNPAEIELTGGMMAPDPDFVAKSAEMGFERLIVAPPGFDRDGISRGFEAFAATFLE